MTDANHVYATIAASLETTAKESDPVKIAVLAETVRALIPPPGSTDVGWLWKTLVGGLLALMLLALGGIIWTIADGRTSTSADVLVTIFTSTLTGLIGLFVTSPTSK